MRLGLSRRRGGLPELRYTVGTGHSEQRRTCAGGLTNVVHLWSPVEAPRPCSRDGIVEPHTPGDVRDRRIGLRADRRHRQHHERDHYHDGRPHLGNGRSCVNVAHTGARIPPESPPDVRRDPFRTASRGCGCFSSALATASPRGERGAERLPARPSSSCHPTTAPQANITCSSVLYCPRDPAASLPNRTLVALTRPNHGRSADSPAPTGTRQTVRGAAGLSCRARTHRPLAVIPCSRDNVEASFRRGCIAAG